MHSKIEKLMTVAKKEVKGLKSLKKLDVKQDKIVEKAKKKMKGQ